MLYPLCLLCPFQRFAPGDLHNRVADLGEYLWYAPHQVAIFHSGPLTLTLAFDHGEESHGAFLSPQWSGFIGGYLLFLLQFFKNLAARRRVSRHATPLV